MKEYELVVASPEGKHFQGNVVALYLRGCEGDLAVLADHTPFITAIKPCEMRIEMQDCSEKKSKINGGLLTVSNNSAIILTSECIKLEEIV